MQAGGSEQQTNAAVSASDTSPSVSSNSTVAISTEVGRVRRSIRKPNRFNDCVMEYETFVFVLIF